MGQQYSTEVHQFRKQSKKEAKSLGFLPNKRAVVHPLNQPPKQTKDPRSGKQSNQWESEARQNLLAEVSGDKQSLVIDIMEARRIGICEVSKLYPNYVVFKFEVVNERGKVVNEDFTQYKTVFDDRGWKYDRWIDKFRMVSFNLWADGEKYIWFGVISSYYYRIAMKYGTLENTRHRNEQSFKELYEASSSSHPIYFSIKQSDNFMTNRCKLNPTWYQWKNTDVFIKIE